MTLEELSLIKKMLGDLRWMQAAALAVNDLASSKAARAYIQDISRLEKVVADEIHKELIK